MKNISGDPVTKFFISVIGLVVVLLVLKELQFIFIPLAIAYFLYFVFEPVNKLLENHKVPKVAFVVADLIILILLFWGISHVFIASFERMGAELPQYENKINLLVRSAAVSLNLTDPSILNFDLNSWLLKADYSSLAGGVFSSTVSFFSTTLLILFFFIFISSGHKNIFEAVKDRYVEKNIISSLTEEENGLSAEDAILKIKSERGLKVEKAFGDITGQVQKYITMKFLINLVSGIIFTVVLLLFGVDYAIVWGAFSFMFNFIPNIGSIFSVVFPSLMSLIQFGSFGYTGIILVTLIVIQNIIGNIIEPKIFGDRLGINPIVILISLLLWGYTWGIIGMFISVPLTAIIKITISQSGSKNLKFISRLMSN